VSKSYRMEGVLWAGSCCFFELGKQSFPNDRLDSLSDQLTFPSDRTECLASKLPGRSDRNDG